MWINCELNNARNIKIKYKIEDGFFYVEAKSENVNIDETSTLIAHFAKDTSQKFEIGHFTDENGIFVLRKKYSLSYFESIGADISSLLSFSVELDDSAAIIAYPPAEDKSITRAKELLLSIKGNTDYKKEAERTIDTINRNLSKYKQNSLPFLIDYTWYKIDNKCEYFDVSAVAHILNSDGFKSNISSWYFGKSAKERLYAMAVRCEADSENPMSNANDCTMIFSDEKNNCVYYVLGIMFLDDGQYFCRLV